MVYFAVDTVYKVYECDRQMDGQTDLLYSIVHDRQKCKFLTAV